MAAARSAGDAGPNEHRKGTKATSCTSCRQVKLKCDLSVRHPSACSRCKQRDLDCKTDAQFKRIPARSRVKDLEAQVKHLSRSQATSSSSTDVTSSSQFPLRFQTSLPSTVQLSTSNASLPTPTIGSDSTTSNLLPLEICWLQVPETPTQPTFTCHDCVLTYFDVLDLFKHFENVYYSFFTVLEPVTSLTKLAEDSQLLFWTIICIASRHHDRHYLRYEGVRVAYERLYSDVCSDTLQNVLDLQAVLLICTWPCLRDRQLRDPSYMQLGMVLSAARQVGLDKMKDEMFFGARRTVHRLSAHSPAMLRDTWLKCFELDLEMSLWHGVLPTLASPHHLRTLKSFCHDTNSSCEYHTTMELRICVAECLNALEDDIPARLLSSTMWTLAYALDTVKTAHASTWTPHNEVALLTGKMYLSATCFVKLVECSQQPADHFNDLAASSHDCLHAAQTHAVQLIDRVVHLAAESRAKVMSHLDATHSFPGSPKYLTRHVFLAATVLLRFLDTAKDTDRSIRLARDAFQKAYEFFNRPTASREHVRAARTLEVAGRAIGHGQSQLIDNVTTRMAASLVYNVIWLGGLLRGRQHDVDYSPAAAELSQISERLQIATAVPVMPALSDSTDHTDVIPESTAEHFEHEISSESYVASDLQFPFGVWDETIYQSWADASMSDMFLGWDPSIGDGPPPV